MAKRDEQRVIDPLEMRDYFPPQPKPRDEWKETWDWAHEIWGEDKDYSFNRFFRDIACKRAKAEGWEEVGSSDVWHASYWAVKRIKEDGVVKTREDLQRHVREHMGSY
jgi:hypothetical protein